MRVSVRARTINFELKWPLDISFILALSRSISKVQVIGQSSRSREENIAKVVGATSSEGFLVTVFRRYVTDEYLFD